MFKRKPNSNVTIDTLIGATTQINGDVVFSGGLHVDGQINGNVSGHSDAGASLSIGEGGGIEGSVSVSDLVLNGIVKGDIEATGRVELGETARVLGNVKYSVIETAVGAQINGKLIHRMNDGPASAEQGPSGDPRL